MRKIRLTIDIYVRDGQIHMADLYLPPDRRAASDRTGLDWEQQQEQEEKQRLIAAFEKALKDPAFMVVKIKDRDCPIYERWCSVIERGVVTRFLCDYIKTNKKKYPKVSTFDMLNEVSIVFPTVDTMDMFQMINYRNSHKTPDLQWTGHAVKYYKTWKNIDMRSNVLRCIINMFIDKFDDIAGVLKLVSDIEQIKCEYSAEDESTHISAHEEEYLSRVDTLKQAVYINWFKRVEESVDGLGEFHQLRSNMWAMLEYQQALGVTPYEPVRKRIRGDVEEEWYKAIYTIPTPHSIIIVKNKRDNSYVCWNYQTNTRVPLDHYKHVLPFDTKLVQLLKAEYMFAELLNKQNGVHLSNGYILTEEKEVVDENDEQTEDEMMADRERVDDEAEWSIMKAGLDDDVDYAAKRVHRPDRIVMQGAHLPPKPPHISKPWGVKRGCTGGRKGVGGRRGKLLRNPAEELLKSFQNQVHSGERTMQEVSKLLKSSLVDENKHLKTAGKKLDDLMSTRHDFIAKINRNLDTVTKEITHISDYVDDGDESRGDGTFGVVPIRKMVSSISQSMSSVHDMITKLDSNLVTLGINPHSISESEMFKEQDIRMEASSASAVSRVNQEMRAVLDTVDTMLTRMEEMMNNFTSSIGGHTTMQERTGVNDMLLNLDDFGDDFAGIISGAGDVAPASMIPKAGDQMERVTELYVEYNSKMKEAREMYNALIGNYKSLLGQFRKVQEVAVDESSKQNQYKTQAKDARSLSVLYKKCLNTQIQLNTTGMTKIEDILTRLELKLNEAAASKQESREKHINHLQTLQLNLENILSSIDNDEEGADEGGELATALVQSDTTMQQLKRDRMADLERVSETYRLNLGELQNAVSIAEENRDARRVELLQNIRDQDADERGAAPSMARDVFTHAVNDDYDAPTGCDDYNKKMYEGYKEALKEYEGMSQTISENRALAIKKAQLENMKQREELDKARIRRATAVKERNQMKLLKKYSTIQSVAGNAKRRKQHNGGHVANDITLQPEVPRPQIISVKEHFRKAKLLSGVPERHMKDTRCGIEERWGDFINNVFPSTMIVDNHGVKTWMIDDDSVMENVVLPFFKLKYGVAVKTNVCGRHSESLSIKQIFFRVCDEFITNLLLNTTDGDFKKLLPLFKPTFDLGVYNISQIDNGRR